MKKRMHSIICLLLAVLLTASCGSTDTPADTTASGGEDTTTAAPEYDRIAELGAHDFGGDMFTILDQADINSNCPVEERDGDILNDTIRMRNEMIEEMYNIKFEYVAIPDAPTRAGALRNSVMADDNDYDLIFSVVPNSIGTLATEGILADLAQIDVLSLEREWWSPLLYDSVRLGGKMYFSTGDISPISYRSPVCFYANQMLLEDNQVKVDEIYDHVENGTWTFDQMYTYAGDLDRDLNGDGNIVMEDDFLGIANEQGDTAASALICAAGVSLSSIDKDGNLYVDLNNELAINAIEKLKNVVCKATIRDKNNLHTAFKEDRIMFFMHYGSSGYTRYRDMNSDYLMLPIPKVDEKQENYRSLMNTWMNCFVAVPTNGDLERAGVIMESMAFWSHNNLREVSFDMALKEKGARNERDADMMNIIMDTLYLDFNSYVKFGGSLNVIMNAIFKDAPYVSSITAIEDKIDAAIADFTASWLNESAE